MNEADQQQDKQINSSTSSQSSSYEADEVVQGIVDFLSIRVTEVGEYVRYHACDRRFKLNYDNYSAIPKNHPCKGLLFENLLDPVLQASGQERENECAQRLVNEGFQEVKAGDPTEKNTPWLTFCEQLQFLVRGQNAFAREVYVEGVVGAFHIRGQIDFVLLQWNDDQPTLRLVECKASRKDQTYHRVQVALYRMLVEGLLQAQPVDIDGYSLLASAVNGVVVRIEEATNQMQDFLNSEAFNLAIEEADLQALLNNQGSLQRILKTSLEELDYTINGKCSDCIFSVHCLAESAIQHRLELLAIQPPLIRVLREAGIVTIDDLVKLDLSSQVASQVRSSPGFTENLERLQTLAKTRLQTLPKGKEEPDAYEVESLPHPAQSQLPQYEIDGKRLVRVYLVVDYDYVENRIGALSAHITNSRGELETSFKQENGRWVPDPVIRERIENEVQPIQGSTILSIQDTPWTGNYSADTVTEQKLLESFFIQLIREIKAVAGTDDAHIHFYVWSHQEMKQLVEGCTRTSTKLLGHLQELLGCREFLEQPIYSCVQQEVNNRYALGWTGRDLTVVTSLKWFGQRYHWHRQVRDKTIVFDHEFRQDLFDYRRQFHLTSGRQWDLSEQGMKHTFEVRLRLQKSLSAPYWRALWGTLPDPATVESRIARAIERYNVAKDRQLLDAFLEARTHALRWVEERIKSKNQEMTKISLDLNALASFSLGVDNVVKSALDFLRLDHHIAVTNWIANNLNPPLYRVSTGRMIPLKDVHLEDKLLVGTIAYETYGLDPITLENNCTFEEGGFVRLAPSHAEPSRPQTLKQLTSGGSTCIIQSLNFHTGRVALSVIPTSRYKDGYTISSWEPKNGFGQATLDESITDFVAGKVDNRLEAFKADEQVRNSVCIWFDPIAPQIPPKKSLDAKVIAIYRSFLQTLNIPGNSSSYVLAPDQQQAILEGLEARVQLLQGPPGTGKTETTSVATFLRILTNCSIGDVVIIAAPTHTAVDTLLHRIAQRSDLLVSHAQSQGLVAPCITLLRLESREPQQFQSTSVQCVSNTTLKTTLAKSCKTSVVVIGSTTNAILKYRKAHNFSASILIVDEASMMVFPHFLALATLVNNTNGSIMLAGDHRQLSPIVAHDWEEEDRPPAVKYQPFVSAYEAVRRLQTNNADQIRCSALSYTFRLPSIIRQLLDQLYKRDNIQLQGRISQRTANVINTSDSWNYVWSHAEGLYLVIHSERQSQSNNKVEVAIIKSLLDAASNSSPNSIAIVTPHRAQRALLKLELADYYGNGKAIGVIDTVEKLQGGECSTIIMSASVSDPTAITNEVDFILGLNRSNVAFSRTKQRLIVVCAESLIDYIPPDYEQYQDTILWKTLRNLCKIEIAKIKVNDHTIRVLEPSYVEPV